MAYRSSSNSAHGPGGRITFTSQIARCAGYDVQAVYEGINDWNASIVFPKTALPAFVLPIPPIQIRTPRFHFPKASSSAAFITVPL